VDLVAFQWDSSGIPVAFLWDAFEDAQMMPEPSVSREAGETHTHTQREKNQSIKRRENGLIATLPD